MRLLYAMLVGMFPAFTLQAQSSTRFWVESMNTLTGEDITPQINVSVTHTLTPKVGIYVWALQSSGFSEIHFGPTFSPVKGVVVSAGVGLENHSQSGRFAADIFLFHSAYTLYGAGETGGSGGWYLIEGNKSFSVKSTTLGIGFRGQRFVGFGPRVEFKLDKFGLVWAVPVAWDPESDGRRSAIFAFRLTP